MEEKLKKKNPSTPDERSAVWEKSKHKEPVHNPEYDNHDGPIFRIMWGKGIEEHDDGAGYPLTFMLRQLPQRL